MMLVDTDDLPLKRGTEASANQPGPMASPRSALDSQLLIKAQEMVHVGTWVVDVDPTTSRFEDAIRWSDEMYRMVGLEPQAVPMTFALFVSTIHPDDRERVRATIDRAHEARLPFRVEYRVATADGRLKVHHIRASLEFNAGGEVVQVLGTCTDVTDRYLAQQALAESESRLRAVFEQSAVGMVIADVDGKLIQVNRSFADFLGYPIAGLEGMSYTGFTHPDDIAAAANQTQRASFGTATVYERRYIRRDGTVVWGKVTLSRLRFPNKPDAYMAVIEDISDHRRASQQLERQTEMLQGMLDHLPVMVLRTSGEGHLIYSNRECQRVFGWTVGDAPTNVFHAAFPDPDQRALAQHMLAAGEAKWIDVEPRAADGRVVPSSWAAITLSNGESLVIGQDLTERRQMQKGLLQSQKMEALGQLAGGVAHDFNNLLTVIAAGATFIQDAAGGDPKIAADTQDILTACARAAALTRQLLAFSRRQMLQPEVLNANEVIQALSKTMRRLLGEQVELEVACEAEHPSIEVDRHQLEQVILNLAVNARDAITERGTITLATHSTVAEHGQRQLVIQVRDDGSGIDPAIMHRIFEPFFTTKPLGKGTGLGLATVHGIVEQSGGRLGVDSTPGKGSTFSVYLPSVDAVPIASARPSVEMKAEGGTETILLVEDESAVRAIAHRMLTSLGYTVIEARHGRDALTVAADTQQKIDVLVTDVVMPEMGGRELVAALRVLRPALPVLFISGYTDDELMRRGVMDAGTRLLRKPFAKPDIARALRALLTGAAAKASETVGGGKSRAPAGEA